MKRPDGPSARHGVFAWMAVAVALALAVGAAYGFWSTTAQSDLLYLASLLESDQRVAVDTVHKYAAATSAIVADDVCRGDVLAAGLARLLLWTDPSRLPRLGDADGAWQLYVRTWRPS